MLEVGTRIALAPPSRPDRPFVETATHEVVGLDAETGMLLICPAGRVAEVEVPASRLHAGNCRFVSRIPEDRAHPRS